MRRTHLYIDAEWYIGGDVFLIGYAYSQKNFGQLYDSSLNLTAFQKLLRHVKYIYCYGPDVGILETYFGINLRDNYICVNLLRIFRQFIKTASFKLADIEKKFGIIRKETEYKKSIFKIWYDWTKKSKKLRILQYNKEDVIHMLKLWKIIESKFKITSNHLIKFKLS